MLCQHIEKQTSQIPLPRPHSADAMGISQVNEHLICQEHTIYRGTQDATPQLLKCGHVNFLLDEQIRRRHLTLHVAKLILQLLKCVRTNFLMQCGLNRRSLALKISSGGIAKLLRTQTRYMYRFVVVFSRSNWLAYSQM